MSADRRPGRPQYVAGCVLFVVAILGNVEWDHLGLGRVLSHVIKTVGSMAMIVGFLVMQRAYWKALDSREAGQT